jgi:hypothetical protein
MIDSSGNLYVINLSLEKNHPFGLHGYCPISRNGEWGILYGISLSLEKNRPLGLHG